MRPALLLALLAVGCPDHEPVDPAFETASVTSPLVRGLSQVVEVAAEVLGEGIDRVSVDLGPIGGPAEQPLALEDGAWSWSGRLVPDAAGVWAIELRATTADGRTAATTVEVRVNDPAPTDGGAPPDASETNLAPEVDEESLSTSGIVGVRGPAELGCRAVDRDGQVVRVVADLTSLGGARRVELTARGGDRFEWEGELTPTEVGTASVTLVATDDHGGTGVGEAVAVIGPGFRLRTTPDTLAIDVFDLGPRALAATIEPAPPVGATLRVTWESGVLVAGALVSPVEFVDSTEGDRSRYATDALAARLAVRAQPWHWSLRLPITTRVRAHAILTFGGLEAEASGGLTEVTVTQAGREVEAEFTEATREEAGVTTRVFEAGFEWPIEDGANRWLLAFLAKPSEAGTPWKDKWVLPAVTVENGQKTLAPAGHAGLLLGGTRWRSDGGIALSVYTNQVAALRGQYAGFRAKVTAWPE